MDPGAAPEPSVLVAIRRFLLGIVVVGVIGTGVELLLLGHFDGPAQIAPLVLLALALPVLAWHIMAPTATTVWVMKVMMLAFVMAAVVGVGMHLDGNVEFARELNPALAGMELAKKTLAGATPVFAPGSLALLGLVGLAHAYRHPRVRKTTFDREENLQ